MMATMKPEEFKVRSLLFSLFLSLLSFTFSFYLTGYIKIDEKGFKSFQSFCKFFYLSSTGRGGWKGVESG